MRQRGWIGATAALAVVAGGLAVHAQDARPGRGPDGPAARMSPEDQAAFTDARIAGLRAGLKLTADQDKLWPPVEDALRGLARERQEAHRLREERRSADDKARGAGTPPTRDMLADLRFRAEREAASAAAMLKVADAAQPLYASLDDAQKRRLPALTRGLMGPGGPGKGPHGKGPRHHGPERGPGPR